MNSDTPNMKRSGFSKRGKKRRTRLHSMRDTFQLRANRKIRKFLFPLYRFFGIQSILGFLIPGFRKVSLSPGGNSFEGAFLGGHEEYKVIATIGDYGSGKSESHQVAEMVSKQHANAVVTLGDNVYFETGFQTLVGNLYGDYLQAGAFFPATGNHDYSEGRGIALFDRYFDFLGGHRWYSVRFEEVEFFILDSHQALHHDDSFEKQRAWLESTAMSSDAKWKIAVLHHPPHSARSRSQHEFRFPFAQWGICMVMSGHDHTLQHLPIDNVHYVVNGIGGGSIHEFEEILENTEFRLSGSYGAVFLEIRPDTLGVRFVTVPGNVVHSFDIPAPHIAAPVSS